MYNACIANVVESWGLGVRVVLHCLNTVKVKRKNPRLSVLLRPLKIIPCTWTLWCVNCQDKCVSFVLIQIYCNFLVPLTLLAS